MVVSYYGLSCLKLQSGDAVIVADPFGKGAQFPAPRFEARVVFFTDPEAKKDISIAGEPRVFGIPGEYEAGDISFVGFGSTGVTPFLVEWEGIRSLFLGTLSDVETADMIIDFAGTVDILYLVPSGTPSALQKIVSNIDPRIVVPLMGDGVKKSAFDNFVKELGEKPEKMDKLTIKKKGLPAEGQRVVILERA
ncbi:MAG: MBL fold metallo-hydrolase [Patescibacteria group bacterium]